MRKRPLSELSCQCTVPKAWLEVRVQKKTIGVAVEFLLPDLVLKLSNVFCLICTWNNASMMTGWRPSHPTASALAGFGVYTLWNSQTTYSGKPLKMQKCRFIAGLYTLMESPSSCSSPTIRDCSKKFKYCPCPTGWSLQNAEVQTSVMTSRRSFSALVCLVSFFEGFNQSDQSICKTIDFGCWGMLGACFWMCEVWDFTTISQLFIR